MSVELSRLPSGLAVVTDAMPHLETASLGVWAAAGSRNERINEHGISHLLEHLALFGGQVASRLLFEQREDVDHLRRAFEVRLGLRPGCGIGEVAEMNRRGARERAVPGAPRAPRRRARSVCLRLRCAPTRAVVQWRPARRAKP